MTDVVFPRVERPLRLASPSNGLVFMCACVRAYIVYGVHNIAGHPIIWKTSART